MSRSVSLLLAIALLGAVIVATAMIASKHETSQVAAATVPVRQATQETKSVALERAEPSPAERGPSPGVPDEKPRETSPAAPASEFAPVLSMPEGTKAEKKAKEASIRAALSERTMPIYQKRFEAGLAEFISDEQKYTYQPGDDGLLFGVQMPAGGKGTYKTVLPRAEYPALYELHDTADRLKKEAEDLELQEARTAKSQAAEPSPR